MWSAKWLWDATSRFTLGQSCVVLTNATHSTALAFYAWEIPPRFPAECHLSLLSKFDLTFCFYYSAKYQFITGTLMNNHNR